MLYLIKLKSILRYNYVIFIIILLTLIYCIYSYKNINKVYILNDDIFIGIVENIKITDTKVELQVKNNNERLLAIYYLEDVNCAWLSDIDIGYKVRIKGQRRIPSENTNFNLFNYRKYLLSKQIKFIIDIEDISIKSFKQNSFYKIKSSIIKRIEKINGSSYLKSFLLGDTSLLFNDVHNSYISNGISHLFSISGMHVGLISYIVLLLLNKMNNKNLSKILLFLLLLFYTFLVGFSPSILRSVIFMIMIFINKTLKINYSIFKIYILMTCLFLLYNPYYIYNSGFIYSFVISGFLICFKTLLNNKNYFFKLLTISLISFLASVPITLLNNFEINVCSIILNLFFVPFISFIIFPLSFLTFIFPILSSIYLFLIKILEYVSLWCSDNVSIIFIFGKPNILFTFIYYIVIIIILKNIKNFKYYFLLLIILILQYNFNSFKLYPVMTMLDVSQGDSILIELPLNKGNVLIDTGGLIGSSYLIGKQVIVPYLKSKSIRKLDYLIITHGDYDHIGEAITLTNSLKVKNVIFNVGDFNNLELELIKVLKKKNIPYYQNIESLSVGFNKLYFLNTKDYGDENENSSVIYTEINNKKMLFMGDAGIEKEKDILKKYNLYDIDILKVGHHGSNTSSSKEFISSIKPKKCLIPVGKNNRYGHPKKSVLEVLNNCKIYRTDINGGIEIKLGKNSSNIKVVNS